MGKIKKCWTCFSLTLAPKKSDQDENRPWCQVAQSATILVVSSIGYGGQNVTHPLMFQLPWALKKRQKSRKTFMTPSSEVVTWNFKLCCLWRFEWACLEHYKPNQNVCNRFILTYYMILRQRVMKKRCIISDITAFDRSTEVWCSELIILYFLLNIVNSAIPVYNFLICNCMMDTYVIL